MVNKQLRIAYSQLHIDHSQLQKRDFRLLFC